MIKQKLVRFLIDLFGNLYIKLEKHLEYPNDHEILGIKISKLLQKKSRIELCKYMDNNLPLKGFYQLDSTSKIRLGCQLLKNYKQEINKNG